MRYLNGIQRNLFLPFIDHINETHEVIDMKSETDFRTIKMSSFYESEMESLYFSSKDRKYENLFSKLLKGKTTDSVSIQVQGRKVPITKMALEDDKARFSFIELCPRRIGGQICSSSTCWWNCINGDCIL